MRIVGVVLLAVLLGGCGGGGGGSNQPASVTAISLSIASSNLAKGRSAQSQVRGTYSDGSTSNLSSGVTWSSSAPTIASVDSAGAVRASAVGATTITATFGNVSSTATVNVTAAVLDSISVAPSAVTHGSGITTQYTATGTYSDGTSANLTSTAAWASSTPAVAAIDSQSGLATGLSLGSTTISAAIGSVTNSAALNIAAPNWYTAASNPVVGERHTATVLATGKVLVVGGVSAQTARAEAEVYDDVTDTWTFVASLSTPRYSHTATLLANGQVLVVGGFVGSSQTTATASAERYDPTTNTWSSAGQMATARENHTATLLPDGRVLVVGGNTIPAGGPALASAELYDPVANTWSAAAPLVTARYHHTASLMTNGRVLIVGGWKPRTGGLFGDPERTFDSAESYDPVTNAWSPAASMSQARMTHTATTLADGRVLVAGGGLYSAEVYDPIANSWSATPDLAAARRYPTATLLQNGTVLVTGTIGPLPWSEIYDSAGNTWSTTPSPLAYRFSHVAVLLPSGAVLVTGGLAGLGGGQLYSSEVYK